MLFFLFLLLTAVAFVSAALLTEAVRKKLVREACLDVPNERSMHVAPVPRGGGLALLPVLGGGAILTLPFDVFPALCLIAGLSILAYISWRDDRFGAGIAERLAAQMLAAVVGCYALGPEAYAFGGLFPFWIDRALTVLVWTGFMNLYNFMDGIDGLTGTQTLSHAVGAAAVLGLGGGMALLDLSLAAALVGAAGGFLLFNWPPARLFLGDVGSVPLGFLVGFLVLRLAVHGHSAAAFLIPLYYLADGGFTMLSRFRRGEKIWQAHKSHFYQRAAAGVGCHASVVWRAAVGSVLLAALALLSLVAPWAATGGGIAVVAVLLHILDQMAREKP